MRPRHRVGLTRRSCAELEGGEAGEKALRLLAGAIDNHVWRQDQCIDLIPSEMTASPMARLLSIMDPSFRYAEHKKTEAFYDVEVFYYQGTGFIHEVERLLAGELRAYLGCPEVETRVISGQMANTAVFSALVDYLNRADRKAEPRRIRKVVNNHITKGGHLSAQPMGALRDYVARDPRTEMPAVVDIPVLADNPYKVDVPALLDLIEKERPELIILGKSMVLHPEPVYEVRTFLDAAGIDAVLMYDMAHVLGLVGPHFQEPFKEGADIVTGSTHKTFFGTQRGLIGGRWQEPEEKWDLWEAIERRAFPGSVSNHHLGTLLGLLMAAYEMNHFKDAYQQAVIAQRQGLRRGAQGGRSRRGRRPGRRLHRDPPGDRRRRLRPRRGARRPSGGQQHHLQLPGGAGRRGLHRLRRPAPRRRRDDALRHGARGLRRGRRADGGGRQRRSPPASRTKSGSCARRFTELRLLLRGPRVRPARAAAARAV